MDTTSELAKARNRLRDVQRRIADHPLNAPEMLEARALAAEDRDGDREAVGSELARRGLPSIGAQSRALVLGLTSLARLNRKRIRLEQRIEELETARRHGNR